MTETDRQPQKDRETDRQERIINRDSLFGVFLDVSGKHQQYNAIQ